MFGLVVIEGMTLSGHPWIINEIEFGLGIGIINSILAHLLFDKDSTNLHSHH